MAIRKRSKNDIQRRQFTLEQLETRRVLTGLVFDSVITTENAYPNKANGNSVAFDSIGNFLQAGTFVGTVDFDRNASHPYATDHLTARNESGTDGYVAKYDASGGLLWARRTGGSVQSLAVDSNGSIYIAGSFAGSSDFGDQTLNSLGGTDGFVSKLDAQGNFQWANGWGATTDDAVNKIVVDQNGSVTAAATYGTSPRSIELRQLDSFGRVNWTSEFSPGGSVNMIDLQLDSNEDIYWSGNFRDTVDLDPSESEYLITSSSGPSSGYLDGYLAKVTAAGSFQWANTFTADLSISVNSGARSGMLAVSDNGTLAMLAHYLGAVQIQAAGSYYSMPVTNTSTAYLATFDQGTGNHHFTEIFAGDFGSIRSLVTIPSGYAATGYTSSAGFLPGTSGAVPSKGSNDIWVATFNQTGPITWAGTLGGSGIDSPWQMIADGTGGTILTGISTSAAFDFDPNRYTSLDVNDVGTFVLHLKAPRPGQAVTLFQDHFESTNWTSHWVQDSQLDWFRSTQRKTLGSYSAEVDGLASNAALTTAGAVNLAGLESAQLTFDWLIESGFDAGEYVSLDISTNGGASWTQDVRRLSGNVSAENVWHSEVVDLTPYISADLKFRFRSSVSASDEDANVDNVRVTGIVAGSNTPPVADAGSGYAMNEGDSIPISGAASSDPDGSIVSYAWDLDNDGQYDDATGASVNFSTTVSGLQTVGLLVTDNRGASAVASTSIRVNNVAPTANAGGHLSGYVDTPVGLSAAGSIDPGIDIVSYAWDLDDDGFYDDALGMNASFSAAAEGTYVVHVLVTDADGATSHDSATINLLTPSSTKFYVVNGGSPDRTYEYGATGEAVENYVINSGNTQPRGAASNVAGDTVWVADRNRKVYVYDTHGGLRGSWAAGSLASTAAVEGIATDGTGVWIVDSKSDKVFLYSGAANRTSGSQAAASNFALNSSNKNPRGIVTDGSHIWIVDNNTSDKVFKYTSNGALVGSWSIDSTNGSPTGLTIDPTGASQSIWIVDSGTDRVYEYTNGRGIVSGSRSADNSFVLAAGNTNPQGIADPPPAGSQALVATTTFDTFAMPAAIVNNPQESIRQVRFPHTEQPQHERRTGFFSSDEQHLWSVRFDGQIAPTVPVELTRAAVPSSQPSYFDKADDVFTERGDFDALDDVLLRLLASAR